VEAINLKTMAHKNKISGRLRISIVSTGKYVMPYFLSDFMKVNPAVQLFMDVTNKTKVVESLENNEVDFSLVSVLPDHLRIDKVELMQNKLFLVGNNERKFNKRPYDNSIFEDLPLIYREPGSGTRHTMEEYIDRNKIPVHKNMELATNDAIKEAVIAGLGYSIMPLIGIRNELLNGDLQIIPVKGFPIRSTWNLIWMKNKNLSPVALALLDYIRSEKEKIIRDKFQWFEEY
jgi:DNA-binding transcriptional LysR family regulator